MENEQNPYASPSLEPSSTSGEFSYAFLFAKVGKLLGYGTSLLFVFAGFVTGNVHVTLTGEPDFHRTPLGMLATLLLGLVLFLIVVAIAGKLLGGLGFGLGLVVDGVRRVIDLGSSKDDRTLEEIP